MFRKKKKGRIIEGIDQKVTPFRNLLKLSIIISFLLDIILIRGRILNIENRIKHHLLNLNFILILNFNLVIYRLEILKKF